MAENSETEWHGWGRAEGYDDSGNPIVGRTFHIGPLPTRKSIALYSVDHRDGAEMHVHAYFRSEQEARLALEVLDELLEGK